MEKPEEENNIKQENQQEKEYKALLEELQISSWQVELLISGFLFTILASTTSQIDQFRDTSNIYNEGGATIGSVIYYFTMIIALAWRFIIVNLSIHILLRSTWVACLGLRYASGEIDYSFLNFTDRFQKFYQNKRITFDGYIERLEIWSSLVFAFTLIVVSALLSVFLFLTLFTFLTILIDNLIDTSLALNKIIRRLSLLLLLFGLIYAIDWFLGGRLKRMKWFARIYYPFYRLISWMTLATVFRPLYLNFVDHKRGRAIILGSSVYFVVVLLLLIRFNVADVNQYFPIDMAENNYLTAYSMNDCSYETPIKPCSATQAFTIPSKVIEGDYLEFFYRFVKSDNNSIATVCPELARTTNYAWESFKRGLNNQQPIQTETVDVLPCINEMIQISINDSLYSNLEWQFINRSEEHRFGLVNMFDIAHLERGKHQINIENGTCRNYPACDSLVWRTYVITFWKG